MVSLILSALLTQSVDYVVERDGKQVGTAKVSVRLTKEGLLRTDSKMTAGQLQLSTGEVRRPDGELVEKSQVILANGEEKVRVKATVTEGKATIDNVEVLPEKGANTRLKASFWFLRDLPEAGTVERGYDVDLDTKTWVWTESKYIGHESKSIGGKRLETEHVRVTNSKRIIDVWKNGSGQVLISKSSDGITIMRADLR